MLANMIQSNLKLMGFLDNIFILNKGWKLENVTKVMQEKSW